MSSSLCCVECFSDKALKRAIVEFKQFGRCHFCHKNDVSITLISDLVSITKSTIENLSYMFVEEDSGTELIEILDKDFRLFSDVTDKFRLKKELTQNLPDTLLKKYKTENISEVYLQWSDFKEEIIHKNRFFPQTTIYQQAFLPLGNLYNNFQQLIEQLKLPIHPSEYFYRGRISEKVLDRSLMGKPPANLATIGRANPYGISYLYLAKTKEICIKEIRPNNGDTISIAKFNVTQQLNVIDLRSPRETISFLSLTSTNFIEILKLVSLLETFAEELSLPVLPNNSQREYIPTQFITEFFKTHGNLDGIIFNSSYGYGYNLVLFDDQYCISCPSSSIEFVKIKGISFDHEPT
ncbi:RES family NAD+ phosphorylase [Acinetobacter sp. YH12063]|uniref:RES family NAD+ phosphorylase n=1 Tax=Acinetobacter sp. YH12063 TaxID=2601061 RepID=UPI0015D2535E|nr:RES family NAD+ phosphorylase [Acinetobacter sp. YH12063]